MTEDPTVKQKNARMRGFAFVGSQEKGSRGKKKRDNKKKNIKVLLKVFTHFFYPFLWYYTPFFLSFPPPPSPSFLAPVSLASASQKLAFAITNWILCCVSVFLAFYLLLA